MSLWLLVAAGTAVCIAVVALLISLRGFRTSRAAPASIIERFETQALDTTLDGVLNFDTLADQETLETIDPQGALLVEQSGGEVVVVGTESQAREIGTILGAAREKIVQSGRRASGAFDAGIAAQERLGFLVRIHPDDARALHLGKMLQKKVPDGYVRGVVMGPDGKFLNLARLKSASKMSSVASGAAVISSLAMQAQLDRIEKALAQIQESIEAVSQRMDDDDDASRRAADHLLSEVYRVACKKGQLTKSQWEQVAPMAHEVYKLQEKSSIQLDHSIKKAKSLSSKAKNRRRTLNELKPELERALELVNADDRAAAQFQTLRLWHMTCSADPALEETISDTRAQIERRVERRRQSLGELEEIFASPDVRGRVQQIHFRHRKRIRSSGKHLLDLVQRSYLPGPDGPAALGPAPRDQDDGSADTQE